MVCHNRSTLRSFVANRDREFAVLLDKALSGCDCSKINKLYQDHRYRNRLYRRVENRLRDLHGVPRIGEGYIAESTLYNLVKERFPGARREHSPKWIGKQRLDIYIPELRTAIEYHGEQHYEPVEFFGGTEGLALRQERDRQKDALCRREGVRLVVWPYTRPVNEEEIHHLINEIHSSE
jgi:hypothetical protein